VSEPLECPAPWCKTCVPGEPCLDRQCPTCGRYDPPDALQVHNAAGACEPRYHRAAPWDLTRCRCGKVREDYQPGDRVRVWRGVRPGRHYNAKVLGVPRVLGGTLTVPVRWDDGEGGRHTDHIALTHVEKIEP
jgi:hypothetical protein